MCTKGYFALFVRRNSVPAKWSAIDGVALLYQECDLVRLMGSGFPSDVKKLISPVMVNKSIATSITSRRNFTHHSMLRRKLSAGLLRASASSTSLAATTLPASPIQQQASGLASAVLLNSQNWGKETVVNLKFELKKRGLSQVGNKYVPAHCPLSPLTKNTEMSLSTESIPRIRPPSFRRSHPYQLSPHVQHLPARPESVP